MIDVIEKAAAYIRNIYGGKIDAGLILGSGLGEYAKSLSDQVYIPYCDIEGFPTSSVIGHASRFVIGKKFGKTVMVMQGRFHYYEGYDQKTITKQVRVMKKRGIEKLVVTNAAGGVNANFAVPCLMLIEDHINLSGTNPLIGKNLDEFGERFISMTNPYDPKMRQALLDETLKEGIKLERGVYIMMTGPSFETPAEIRMARTMGADAVGMSTVPEVIVANHCSMKCLGISCITNAAAGITGEELTHKEVLESGEIIKKTFEKVIDIAIEKIL